MGSDRCHVSFFERNREVCNRHKSETLANVDDDNFRQLRYYNVTFLDGNRRRDQRIWLRFELVNTGSNQLRGAGPRARAELIIAIAAAFNRNPANVGWRNLVIRHIPMPDPSNPPLNLP